MSNYTQLSVTQKQDIIRSRILQWEGERYGHESDVERFQALVDQRIGSADDQQGYAKSLDLAKRSIEMLDVSIDLAVSQLEQLG